MTKTNEPLDIVILKLVWSYITNIQTKGRDHFGNIDIDERIILK
jgi:hypothetical protein